LSGPEPGPVGPVGPAGPAALLAGAIHYALGSVSYVTPRVLTRRTPCAEWDLSTLLGHVNDSLAAFHEGIARGYVDLEPAGPPRHVPAEEDVVTFRARAARLLATATATGREDRPVAIADRRAAGSIVTAVGAVELAVHGWDVAAACGRDRPIPPGLATAILEVAPMVVTDATRQTRFAAPITVSPGASPSDRLVALLGRNPHRVFAITPR
jgi:uncharacterized protein (TIGR03086 family)